MALDDDMTTPPTDPDSPESRMEGTVPEGEFLGGDGGADGGADAGADAGADGGAGSGAGDDDPTTAAEGDSRFA